MVQGNEKEDFFPFERVKVITSGKPLGRRVQIPSVSSSKGMPSWSISERESVIMALPVWVTIAAISIECQRAPLLIT